MKFEDAKKKIAKMFESDVFIQRIKEEDSTMLKQLPLLQKINGNGFLTTESQAGRYRKGISKLNGEAYEILERAYVCGFMLEKDAASFIKKISINTDKNALFVPICSNNINIPPALDIPLTITKKHDEIEINTHMSVALPTAAGDHFKKMLNLNKTEKVVFIFCFDTKWCRLASGKNGLFTDILRNL
jgi:hypothetical protein